MGTMDRQWTVKEAPAPERVEQLSTELGIDRVLADLLVQRGIETFDEARSPSLPVKKSWCTETMT